MPRNYLSPEVPPAEALITASGLTDSDFEVVEGMFVDVGELLPQPEGVVSHGGHMAEVLQVAGRLSQTWRPRDRHFKTPLKDETEPSLSVAYDVITSSW